MVCQKAGILYQTFENLDSENVTESFGDSFKNGTSVEITLFIIFCVEAMLIDSFFNIGHRNICEKDC